MAFILSEHSFDPDQLPGKVLGIASDLGKHDSGLHRHHRHQLLFAQAGCMSIELDSQLCLLPPSRAAWIPAGTVHRVLMRGVVAYRSLYFIPECPLPTQVQVMAVNPLLREIIERIAFWPWDKPEKEQQRTMALFMEELLASPLENWQLPMPKDKRLALWLRQIQVGGELPERLNQLALRVGASGKTISRIFMADTGMSYQAWRQQWRLLRAMELLAELTPISQIASQLEFSSDSAFISYFKQHTGQTPLCYRNCDAKPYQGPVNPGV